MGALTMTDKQSNVIRILIADDHPVVRTGLSTLIGGQADMKVVGEAGNGKEAIELYRQHQPDVLLMDIRMPLMSGVDATVAIRGEFPQSRIIILTTYEADEDIVRTLRAGAQGYLLKDTVGDEMLEAIRAVYAGQRRVAPAVGARLAERVTGAELTVRELEVLKLMSRGGTNKELATSLSISEGTVKGHVNNILSKLGVTDRTMAVTTALQRGIIHLD
jgi:two-component system NarL family response regulator